MTSFFISMKDFDMDHIMFINRKPWIFKCYIKPKQRLMFHKEINICKYVYLNNYVLHNYKCTCMEQLSYLKYGSMLSQNLLTTLFMSLRKDMSHKTHSYHEDPA